MILRDAERVTETLIVYDFALAEIPERVTHIGIVAKTNQVVVGNACLLLCYNHLFATKLSLIKVRKILIFQGLSALLRLPIF